MHPGKYKNVALLLLLLINLLLGGNLLINAKHASDNRELAVAYLKEHGVELKQRIPRLPEEEFSLYLYTRSADAEKAAADALIGDSSLEQPGGGTSVYQSDRGAVTFSRNGALRVVIRDVGRSASGADEAGQLVTAILGAAGIEGELASLEGENGVYRMTFSEVFAGFSVYNGRLDAVLTDRSLEVTGLWMLKREGAAAALNEALRSPEGLALSFVNAADEKGVYVGSIENMRYGFCLVQRDDSSFYVMPVCAYATLSGVYYVSLLDGILLDIPG